MGEHGLKDLTRPEHVFQINIEGLDSEFPPLKSLDSVPNNLPEQLTEFIGRDTELTRAKQLVGETRLLTILAPGGTGKTRLGIQAAADLISEFPDGVFFVALADLDSSSEIVQSIAEALGVGLSSDEDPKSQLLTYLSNKTQLLVVDNFEQIADGAVIISEILEAGPAVRIVATSRVKLNLSGETVLTLGGLSSTWDTPQEAMQTGGVQLFLAAALRADSGFTLQAGDLDSVAEILRLTGGSPLGILLAAAWVDMLPVSEIAAEVAQSLDFLETEMGDVPDRHRSVRAVFDYSWGLLGEEEKEMYAALSVFRGGFTREAAASVAGASLRNLATLLNKSLVTSSVDKSRYSVHELLRQYASDELDKVPERSRAVSEAHGATYGDLMEGAGEIITRSDQPAFLASVDQDIDNVRSAWRYYLSTGNAESAARFPADLYHIYEVRGWYTAGAALFEEALEAFEADSHDEAAIAVRAISAAIQGSFLSLLGQPSVGTAAALEAWDALPDSASDLFRWLTAQCIGLGMAYLGTTDDMAAVFDRAMEIANRDDPVWKAGMKNWRSFTALLAGDIETARVLVPEAMEVLEARGDHYYMTWNFWLQAMMATMDGRLDDAVDLYARQVARAEEIGYLRGKVVAFEGLGDASVAAGRLDAAETAFVRGIEVAEQMGMVRDMLGMMTKVANVWSAMERRPEAVELLGSVCADPISAQQPFTANVPIADTAASMLADLRAHLDEDEYESAHSRGMAKPYDVAAKQLMDGLGK